MRTHRVITDWINLYRGISDEAIEEAARVALKKDVADGVIEATKPEDIEFVDWQRETTFSGAEDRPYAARFSVLVRYRNTAPAICES